MTKLKKRIEQVAEHIAGYLADLDTADRLEGEAAEARAGKLKDKIATLRAQMQALKAMEPQVAAPPDGQVSLTDPDARAMATSGRGSGIVGCNVQSAVDAHSAGKASRSVSRADQLRVLGVCSRGKRERGSL